MGAVRPGWMIRSEQRQKRRNQRKAARERRDPVKDRLQQLLISAQTPKPRILAA
jgi:hypothetical protein